MTKVQELFSLKGKCAVVVGGAGRIGAPMAEALAEAGACVYIASRSSSADHAVVTRLAKAGLDVRASAFDQSDETSVKGTIETIAAEHSMPAILVNSGVERPMTRFLEDDVESWDRSMAVNARGLFVTCRAFARGMAANGGGSIINVASIYGLVAPDPAMYEGSAEGTEPDYPYTKGGMIMFSKYLATYYASQGVRVNCIAPGGLFDNQPEPFYSRYIAKVPMKRMAAPDDLKGVTVLLASAASAYITGAVIPVDGGWTAW
jgi:NAD(P)-dependent dehydrogenase (short-subunit alcohol dehydrogenase family)